MPIDASIPLQVRTPEPGPNPLDSLARVLQIKNEQARQQLIPGQVQLQQAQLQGAGLENQQRQIELTENQGVKDAITKAYQNGGDLNDAIPGIMQASPIRGATIQKTLLENKKAIQDLQNSALDHTIKNAGFVAQTMTPVKDPDGYAAALATLHAAGVDTSTLDPVYDPAKVQAVIQKGTGIAEQLAQKKEERESAAQNVDVTAKKKVQALEELGSVTDQASFDAWNARNPVMKGIAPPMYSPAAVAQLQRQAVPVEKQPEYDIQTRTAQAMAAMKPEDWQAQVDHIAPPKGDTAGLNNRTRVLVNSAVIRGDYKAAQAAIKDASDQLGREDVAKKNAQTKISLDMGAFSGANGEMSPTAMAVAHYQIPSAQAMSRMSPQARDALMRQVLQINPAFREQQYATFQSTEKDAVTGKIGTSANALNTMMGHLSVLDQAGNALDSHDVQALNKIANFLGVQTGGDAVTTYNTIVHRIGPEVTKAYIAGGGTGGERGTNEEDFSANLSRQQRKANIGVSAQLADSKIKALQDQYTRGTYGLGGQKLISDEAEQARQRLAAQSPAQGGGGWQATATGKNGHKIGTKDGGKTWVDIQTGKPIQ